MQCVIHSRNLKQALYHRLIVKKKVQRVIKFSQKDWSKSCIELRQKIKMTVKKIFLRWQIIQFLVKP